MELRRISNRINSNCQSVHNPFRTDGRESELSTKIIPSLSRNIPKRMTISCSIIDSLPIVSPEANINK